MHKTYRDSNLAEHRHKVSGRHLIQCISFLTVSSLSEGYMTIQYASLS